MIAWESDMSKALARAKAEQKCVLLEFFSPDCIGCREMETVTFPEVAVTNFLSDKVIPLRATAQNSKLAADFRVVWTPTFLVLDLYGTEHQRTIGYIPPGEMVASVLLGIAKAALTNGQYNEAVLQLNTLLNGYPESYSAPEAVYLRGVARFRSSQDQRALKDCYNQLSREYGGSEWSKRAAPFALL